MKSVIAPLFAVKTLGWTAPDPDRFDALLLTSANAPRQGGDQLGRFALLPCYCVGEATAAEARKAGFSNVRVGPSDGQAVLGMIAGEGVVRVLHLSGKDHVVLKESRLQITRAPVYVAEAGGRLAETAKEALQQGALALLHSPRAARLFGDLVDRAGLRRATIRLAAISAAAAEAAGPGWAARAAATTPRDQALLELAAKLCNTDAVSGTGLSR